MENDGKNVLPLRDCSTLCNVTWGVKELRMPAMKVGIQGFRWICLKKYVFLYTSYYGWYRHRLLLFLKSTILYNIQNRFYTNSCKRHRPSMWEPTEGFRTFRNNCFKIQGFHKVNGYPQNEDKKMFMIFLTKASVQLELYPPEWPSLVLLACSICTAESHCLIPPLQLEIWNWNMELEYGTWNILANIPSRYFETTLSHVQPGFVCSGIHLQMFCSLFPGPSTGTISVAGMSWGWTDFKCWEFPVLACGCALVSKENRMFM